MGRATYPCARGVKDMRLLDMDDGFMDRRKADAESA
jgi:hypothetical protein